jgi:Mn2+/Fe2+ NRAMP family transporter
MLVPDQRRRTGVFRRPTLATVAPGVVTGAADDDPSAIATYAQAGAQFGLAMAWVMLVTLPLMTAVQDACARVGAVTGNGLAAVLRDYYDRRVLIVLVWLMLAANTLNIGADIAAMAESTKLLVPLVPLSALAIAFSILIVALQMLMPYRRYVRLLKWLVLALLAYPITAIVVHPPWASVLRATITPHINLNLDFLYILTGVVGTTVGTPYLMFWEASQVVEEENKLGIGPKAQPPAPIGTQYLRNLRTDNAAGMLGSQVAGWFILITAASVLYRHGLRDIATAADAARALEPLVRGSSHAGFVAKVVFTTGIVGLGLVAIPTMAAANGYALSETYGWSEGLSRGFREADHFYEVIVVSTVIGLVINFIGINPIKALIFTSVVNGIASIPMLFCLALVVRNPRIMGSYTSGWLSTCLLWLTFGSMLLSATLLVGYFFR